MSDNEKSKDQSWIVSLGISVFCCAVFFTFMSAAMNKLNNTLDSIDARLSGIEARDAATAAAPPVPVVVAPPGTTSSSSGTVINAPTPQPPMDVAPQPAPANAPPPEAVAPVLPSVPPSAAPLDPDAPTPLTPNKE